MNEKGLSTGDYYYDLPRELIAQTPLEKRDESRLLVLDRASGRREHRKFYNITEYLNPGDVLVINDSRVIPARIYGKKLTAGGEGAEAEVVLLRARGESLWECLVRPGRRLREGAVIDFSGVLRGVIEGVTDSGDRLMKLEFDGEKYASIFDVLDEIGSMPTPPYITEKLSDRERYQTVYANEAGSAAAPTAGLHFTTQLLEKIRASGVFIAPVMLHVGLGTFRPVKTEDITKHKMHSEFFTVSQSSADVINSARANGGRIIAVGTTCARVLESAADPDGVIHPVAGDTDIFIYPGYRFCATDALITNFHLPESTLLMLVSAMAGRQLVLDTYAEAIRLGYRFFSFGDACLIM